ncbi:MAG: OsmC family peroxiredoxin [SAR202 cluster bacterium]|nr:OsmC family peroxiredoxin [SAR202 cluster bacterium]
MAAVRTATATWNGDLMTGSGTTTAASSGQFKNLGVSWAARTEAPGGKTSPEELLAAAHASCFCMALSAGLARAKTPPTKLEVSVSVTFDKVETGMKVTSSAIKVTGIVPGIDAATFKKAAEGAKDGCPISGALKGNVALSVEATLAK